MMVVVRIMAKPLIYFDPVHVLLKSIVTGFHTTDDPVALFLILLFTDFWNLLFNNTIWLLLPNLYRNKML